MALGSTIKEWVKDIAFAVIASLIILQFVKPTIVREHSMENTLKENDYIFVSRQAYTLFGDYERGDIVVFKSDLMMDNGEAKFLVKRVIAIPGDAILIAEGQTQINGKPVEEPYTKDGYTATDMEEVTVPEGQLFVMGDNRQNSMDSRDARVGFVPMESVIGKAVFRLFPFKTIGKLE